VNAKAFSNDILPFRDKGVGEDPTEVFSFILFSLDGDCIRTLLIEVGGSFLENLKKKLEKIFKKLM